MVGAAVSLAWRGPYDWRSMLAFLAARAVDGVELVQDGVYSRSFRDGDAMGVLQAAFEPGASALVVQAWRADLPEPVLDRLRRVFDLDADVAAIAAHLSRDPDLAALVAARPGLRAPGGFDGFELAVRAVLGQQVSVQAARRLCGRLAAICGPALPQGPWTEGGLTRVFPSAAEVEAADLSVLPMPGARKAALKAIAEAALDDPGLFDPGAGLDGTIARLRAVRGVGPWTAHYIALRAVREPDAFPSSDVGLLRGLAGAGGKRATPAELERRAEAWRPWRAYAAQHLWAADAEITSPG
jgi:AraC family transcriptional regulator of adaptative response / DNA-3-methyladenine glycosylase II